MNKTSFLFVFITMLLLSGCNSIGMLHGKLPEYIPKNTDIVDTHGKVENMDRLEEFVNHVDNERKDQVRVVRYTVEGDPILRDIEYDGTAFKTTIDSRRDEYGNGNVTSTTCTAITKIDTTESTDYVLEGCNQPIDDIIISIRNRN